MDTTTLVITARRMGIVLDVNDADTMKHITEFSETHDIPAESRSGALVICFAKAIVDKGIIVNEQCLADEIALRLGEAYRYHIYNGEGSKTLPKMFEEELDELGDSLRKIELKMGYLFSIMVEKATPSLISLLESYLDTRAKERLKLSVEV